MASLILDNIPDDLLKRLKERAESESVSPEEEALRLLREALEEKPSFVEALEAFRAAHEDEFEDEDAELFEGLRDPAQGREVKL